MILDKVRTDAYAEALRARVRDDSIVLDIGTGTGILAFLACRCGARKVYAVEASNIIQLARQAAAANGLADRIEFIQGISTRIDLPEKVDVIVSEIHGVLPAFENSLTSIMDARDRFLAPGGHLIPKRETLWAALVHAPEAYDALVAAWESARHGFDFAIVRKQVLNSWRGCFLRRDQLVTEAHCWTTLDYRTLSTPNLAGQATWTLDRSVTVHGITAWFDCETAEGITFSNSAGARNDNVFGQAFFPWLRPMELLPGDQVAVQIRAQPAGQGYVWCWNADITPGTGASRTQVFFRQSTFQVGAVSLANVRKRGQSFVPTLSEDGRIDREILQQMADGLPLEQIARALAGQFPHRFPTWQSALDHVADLSTKYSL
jgi:protein arginine N-methyltransferase 1